VSKGVSKKEVVLTVWVHGQAFAMWPMSAWHPSTKSLNSLCISPSCIKSEKEKEFKQKFTEHEVEVQKAQEVL
jgi:hypothetical protein